MRPRFEICESCHRDPHAGQATLAGKRAGCDACHRVGGFRPSTFTAAQHQASPFPLLGKHLEAKCEGCHPRDPRAGATPAALRPPHGRCGACHGDAHGGQLAGRPEWADCGPCHRVDGWKPSTFTANEHAKLKFALEGKHAAATCAACHALDRKGLPPPMSAEAAGKARIALNLGAIACAGCHATPHGGQFEQRADHGACDGCHDGKAFRPAPRFSHDRDTRFVLKGAHARLACGRCHVPQPAVGSAKAVTVYRPLPTTCKGCHAPQKVAAGLRRGSDAL
jgi:hypothetical protein